MKLIVISIDFNDVTELPVCHTIGQANVHDRQQDITTLYAELIHLNLRDNMVNTCGASGATTGKPDHGYFRLLAVIGEKRPKTC